ncbi:MAG: hypothetical protein B6I18_05985 [Bacteroidetes bacterium 4572_112]|nr:MAG: hypothetical protein B6I18_05985 [Bacteroidetes bacterium 4572_112]
MSALYIHIPFCKQKCHYCNFYSTASSKNRDQLINSIILELQIRKKYLNNSTLETIYFGGGTPSILTNSINVKSHLKPILMILTPIN